MIIRNGWIVSLLWVCASACSVQATSTTNRDATRTLPVRVATVYQPLPSATAYPTQTAYPNPTKKLVVSPTPDGYCRKPPDDYDRVQVNGENLSKRTQVMLENAVLLNQSVGDLLAVTQGSYRTDVDISFGTHAGGGVVDISIRNPADRAEFLPQSEVDLMVQALRQVGFAAWFRPLGAFGNGSAPHIHAVAVGDKELSPAAAQQVRDYFAGLDGLTAEYGGPNADPHGGAIICDWMVQ